MLYQAGAKRRAAGSRPGFVRSVRPASGGALRVVPGSFVYAEQSFVASRGERAKADEIERIVNELRASGFIAVSIQRARPVGAVVSPARQR